MAPPAFAGFYEEIGLLHRGRPIVVASFQPTACRLSRSQPILTSQAKNTGCTAAPGPNTGSTSVRFWAPRAWRGLPRRLATRRRAQPPTLTRRLTSHHGSMPDIARMTEGHHVRRREASLVSPLRSTGPACLSRALWWAMQRGPCHSWRRSDRLSPIWHRAAYRAGRQALPQAVPRSDPGSAGTVLR
jgi:hypothetical protein